MGFDRPTIGMVLGKFLPPHAGHQYLIDFATESVDRLYVVVGTLKREPIPGGLRYEWMRELNPRADVLHLTDEIPQEPHEHPDFWGIWSKALLGILPERPDFVFASEPYGFRLAEELGATYVPVDHARELVPVTGTMVREDPMGSWQYIPDCVRPYFVKRVAVVGPESTGKTCLARDLAAHFKTQWVAEYARPYLELRDDRCEYEDLAAIARGHRASEDALARQANRVLICDTDALTTTLWSEVLFGRCEPWIKDLARARRYDLTLLCAPDVPYVAGPQRYLPDGSRDFQARLETALKEAGRDWVLIEGDWDQRFRIAVQAIERLIAV